MLHEQDKVALQVLFRGSDPLSRAIASRIATARSHDRDENPSGFYSSIVLAQPLDELSGDLVREVRFRHPQFPNGGSYMCSIVSATELDVEAEAAGGAPWPNPTDPAQFAT
jgi:hypothetical protein